MVSSCSARGLPGQVAVSAKPNLGDKGERSGDFGPVAFPFLNGERFLLEGDTGNVAGTLFFLGDNDNDNDNDNDDGDDDDDDDEDEDEDADIFSGDLALIWASQAAAIATASAFALDTPPPSFGKLDPSEIGARASAHGAMDAGLLPAS